MRRIIRKIDYYTVVSVFILIAIAVFGLMGFKFLFVESNSMKPVIKRGDIIAAKNVLPGDSINVGDICTYLNDDKQLITHRVIEVTNGGYIFKGDNNELPDELVIDRNRIRYKIIWYKNMGHS